MFLAQYQFPCAEDVVVLEFTSLRLRCLKDINSIQCKVDHLKINTYQLDRCVIFNILNASIWMQRDFWYPVLISKFSYFILESVPTISIQDFIDHPLFSSDLNEGKASVYTASSSTLKLWSVASFWQGLCGDMAFIPVYSGSVNMVPMACDIITVFIFSDPSA